MCVTSLQLAVTPSMAPVGRLLVFYVRENGEGVADSLQFTVETFFENQVERWDPNWGREEGWASTIQGWGPQGVDTGIGCAQLPLRLHVLSQAELLSNNWNISFILTGASPKVTETEIAFITHREKWSAVLCPRWPPDLRDTAHVPSSGLSLLHPLPAPFKTGCNTPLASACLPTPPHPTCPLHRISQFHQPSSCHSASHSCPHLGDKVRVPSGLVMTDSPWQVGG